MFRIISIKRASGSFLLALTFFTLARAQNYQAISGAKSPQDDTNPVWIDDRTILFTRAFHPSNKGGKTDPGDIWMIQKSSNGEWQKATHRTDLSTEEYDVAFGLENPNSLLIYHQGSSLSEIFQYSKQGKEFVRQKKILISNLNEFEGKVTGRVSIDGQVIILSAKGQESFGNEDLYFSQKTRSGSWTKATNMGAIINTQGQELGAFYDPNSRTLFFSSNMQNGALGKDIFISKKINEDWKSWSTPLKWEQISTLGSDISLAFSPTGNEVVWTSILNSDGFADLMTLLDQSAIQLPGNPENAYFLNNPESETIQQENQGLSEVISSMISPGKSEKSLLQIEEDPSEKYISLYVVDYRSGEIVDFSLRAGSQKNQFEIEISRTFTVAALTAKNIRFVQISADNYQTKILSIDDLKKLEMARVELVPIGSATFIEIEDLIFGRGSAEVEEVRFQPILLSLVTWLDQNPDLKIRINGHTDSMGDPSLNKSLSLQRASNVRKFLIKQGIPPDQLRISGWGGARPIASNDTEEGRSQNRRVEIHIEN